jgi:hypothetical protein
VTTARVLTVRQPWASAIIHAGKDVENRTWPTADDYTFTPGWRWSPTTCCHLVRRFATV